MDASETPTGDGPRIIPDGWVPGEVALAWVAFGKAVRLRDFPYAGASGWFFHPPAAVLRFLTAYSKHKGPITFGMADPADGLPSDMYGVVAATAALHCKHLSHPHDMARAAEMLAAELAANIATANKQWGALAPAAADLRRAVAFKGLPAYGWRPRPAEAPFGIPAGWEEDVFIESPRERIPPEVFAAPVTLTGDELLPIIASDGPDDGCAGLWRSIVFDAPDLLRLWPAPADTAPAVLYAPPQHEHRRRGGRPPHIARKAFTKAMMRRANTPDGLGDMSECIRAMIEWAATEYGDAAPGDTTIREWTREDWPG